MSFYDEINQDIQAFASRRYWLPTKRVFDGEVKIIQRFYKVSEEKALVMILDNLDKVLRKSEPAVMRLVRASGKDIKQSRVSIAGHNYQALVAYALMRNVLVGNLPEIHIALKAKNHPLLRKYGVIKVGADEQKPDADILIYQDKPNTPLVICSCKTSLRERAGQTYRWKLLLDLATTDPRHLKENPKCPVNKFDIKYQNDRPIYVTLVTADLHNETTQPQQKGMFRFFDKAFITSSKPAIGNVVRFGGVIAYLRSVFS